MNLPGRAPQESHEQMSLGYFAHPPRGADDVRRRPGGALSPMHEDTTPSQRRRPWLAWALVLTLLATGWVAMTTEDAEPPTAAVTARPSRSRGTAFENSAPVPSSQAQIPGMTPQALQASTMELAMARATPLSWPKLGAGGLAAWGTPPQAPVPKVKPMTAPSPPAPAPPPLAPPFPYQLIGSLQQGDQAKALMAGPVRTVALIAGEVVDGQWRVDKVDTNAVHLTWLPGAQTQRIEYGAAR